ncbi:MAG: lipid-A-disaccharide synthase N-terminal domain-containing protein [Gammaproteobacteria bacterium]
MQISNLSLEEIVWLCIGFIGQGLFFMRFLIQWLHSERVKKSVIPVAFWYFSLFGGMILFVYAIHIRNPVFIVGQGVGLIVYIRNLYFVFRERASA